MTASDLVGDIIFSGATVNLLRDSGWYDVSDQMNDSIFWGKGSNIHNFVFFVHFKLKIP